MNIKMFDKEGKKLELVTVSKQWAEVKSAKQAVKDSVVYYLAKQRQGNAKAKDRSEVNFTTKKPWQQKGTGRARSGTATSPIWRKGGVVFGPKPRDYSIKLPKKVRELALKSIIADKLKNDEIVMIGKIDLKEPKTKDIAELLKKIECGRSPLVVTRENDKIVRLSVRNMPDVGLIRVADLNTYQVISHGKIVIEKDAWSVLEEKVFGAK